jgi:ABC-type antimicrobial peptide transport system permease subunit
MKKLLVAILAISAVSAFAHNHEGKDIKHMVRFYGFNDAGVSNSFDVSTDTNGDDDKTTNIALNYAYAITNNWQIGATYKSKTGEENGSDINDTTMGLSGYYNFDKSLDSTCYVGVHYMNGTNDADDKTTTMAVEYGHRFHVGHVWGLHLTYSPNISYSTSTTVYDDDSKDDNDTTALAWNWIKFDVLF